METYKFVVTLEIEIEAFDPSDALDMIQDTFGLGDNYGVNVVESEIKLVK